MVNLQSDDEATADTAMARACACYNFGIAMDFDQLETFLEVARLLNFSRAAEKRFRTQPAISSQIRALEEEVGAKLLDRSGGKVSVTASGKLFQKFAEEMIELRPDYAHGDCRD